MGLLAIGALVWCALSVPLGILIGKALKKADESEPDNSIRG